MLRSLWPTLVQHGGMIGGHPHAPVEREDINRVELHQAHEAPSGASRVPTGSEGTPAAARVPFCHPRRKEHNLDMSVSPTVVAARVFANSKGLVAGDGCWAGLFP